MGLCNRIVSAVRRAAGKFGVAAASAFVGVFGGASSAFAQTDPDPEPVTITESVAVTDLASQIATIGGAALAAAFGVGAGFLIAKKAYGWMFSRV